MSEVSGLRKYQLKAGSRESISKLMFRIDDD